MSLWQRLNSSILTKCEYLLDANISPIFVEEIFYKLCNCELIAARRWPIFENAGLEIVIYNLEAIWIHCLVNVDFMLNIQYHKEFTIINFILWILEILGISPHWNVCS